MKGFSEVPLVSESFHKKAVAGLAKRREADQMSAGPHRSGQFSSTHAEFCRRITLEGPDPDVGKLPPDFIDPRGVLAQEHLALCHEQRHLRRTPRPLPVAAGNGRLGPVHGLSSCVEVDPCPGKVQAQGGAALDGVGAQRFA